MKILITGATGFIGSHLYTALNERGHTVVPMDKRHGPSTSDWEFLHWVVDRVRPGAIVHLGASCSTAVSLEDPARDFADNVIGTFNVAEAARQAGGVPVLFTSSVKVKPGADGLIAPLGLSKAVGEGYIELYGELYGLPFIINRPSTVYGPGQNGSAEAGWVTWFLRAFLDRRQITIHGDGTQSRDILYIDDFVRLLVDQVENFDDYHGRSYDVGGGPDNEVGLLELVHALEVETGTQHPVTHDARLPGDLQRVVTDNTAITAVRGWQPATHWVDGVRRTLDWMGAQW